MSDIACSQVVRSNSPGPPLRRSGCSTRSGSFWTPVIAMPLGQALPRESGWSSSGRSWISRPSSTVATIPQSGSQMRQKVTFSCALADGLPFAEPLR